MSRSTSTRSRSASRRASAHFWYGTVGCCSFSGRHLAASCKRPATRAAAAESEFGESIDTEVAEEEVVETAAPAAVDEGAAPVDESEEEGFVEESFIDEDEDEDEYESYRTRDDDLGSLDDDDRY